MQIKVPMETRPGSTAPSSPAARTGTSPATEQEPLTLAFEDSDVPTAEPAFEDVEVLPLPLAGSAPTAMSVSLVQGSSPNASATPPATSVPVSEMTEAQLDAMLDAYRKKSGTASTVLVIGTVATIVLACLHMGLLCFAGMAITAIGGVMWSRARKSCQVDEINELLSRGVLSEIFPGSQIMRIMPEYKKDEIDEMFGHFRNRKSKSYYNNLYVNDLVWGEYAGNPFEFCDVHATYEWTDSDGDTHTKEIFTGQYLRFPTDKTLTCDLYIRRKASNEKKKEKDGGIVTDNPDFNEKWHVTSDSEENALYVLTPHFMEKLEEYESVISKSMGIFGKTDYVFRSDGSFVAFVESGANLFELDRVKAKSADGKALEGQPARVSDMRSHFRAETEWMRSVMDVLRFEQ